MFCNSTKISTVNVAVFLNYVRVEALAIELPSANDSMQALTPIVAGYRFFRTGRSA